MVKVTLGGARRGVYHAEMATNSQANLVSVSRQRTIAGRNAADRRPQNPDAGGRAGLFLPARQA